jgi:DNA adenine methylase
MKRVTRPVLRYFGGKWMLAPWIIEHFPAHRIYMEPFGGGASVLLRKRRVYAEIYNDIDSDVVNLFRVLRDPSSAPRLIELLALTPFARDELDAARFEATDPIERARRLVVRSFFGHGPDSYRMSSNSGFRGNAHAAGRTPQADWRNFPDSLAAVVDRLRGVKIENRPGLELLAEVVDPDALVYVDPPYLWDTRTKRVGAESKPHGGYTHEMARADHVALLEMLPRVRGMVVLSGYPSPLYDKALPGWTKVERAAFADGMSERTEMLWLNPACSAALAGQHRQGALFQEHA